MKKTSAVALLGVLGVFLCAQSILGQAPADCTTPENKNHTMCRFTGPNQNCQALKPVQLTKLYRNIIVATTNKLRSFTASGKVKRGGPGPQPGATNMNEVIWDADLATSAQRWADQCLFGGDQQRDSTKFQSVGQNYFAVAGTFADLSDANSTLNNVCEAALSSWYNQVDKFNRAEAGKAPKFTGPSAMYAQLVQWNVKAVGCGSKVFVNNQGRLYATCVCNYGVAKDTETKQLYTPSDASNANVCSACPPATAPALACEDSLCAAA